MAVPNPAQLPMFDTSLALGPLRCVSDALDTLRRWPPLEQEKLVETLDPMVVQLYRLQTDEPAASATPVADPAAPVAGAVAPVVEPVALPVATPHWPR
jgi:hypothetical protein